MSDGRKIVTMQNIILGYIMLEELLKNLLLLLLQLRF